MSKEPRKKRARQLRQVEGQLNLIDFKFYKRTSDVDLPAAATNFTDELNEGA